MHGSPTCQVNERKLARTIPVIRLERREQRDRNEKGGKEVVTSILRELDNHQPGAVELFHMNYERAPSLTHS